MTMDKLNYILHNLPRFMYELLICIHKYNSNMKRWHKTTCYMSSKIQWGPNDYETASKYFIVSKFKLPSFGTEFSISSSDKPFTLFNT